MRKLLTLLLLLVSVPVLAQPQQGRVVTGDSFRLLADGTALLPAVTWDTDRNTGIWRVGADTLAISTGGTQRFTVDANGNVGIGTTAPSVLLHLSGATPSLWIDSYGGGAGFAVRSANGTEASPTASTTNQALLTIGVRGYGATGFASTTKASLSMNAAETWTDAAQGTFLTLNTTAIGGTSKAERLRVSDTGMTLPGTHWSYDLGADATRWRSLYAAELNVWRLVAKDVISTIGGEIWTAETTTLSAALGSGAGDTTLTVAHNFLEDGDFVLLKDLTSIEVIEIDSAAGGSAGAYTYTVVRDKDGTGRNAWATGVAVVSTGKAAGEGFVSQYAATATAGSLLGTPLTLVGPALAGITRTGTTWNNLAPRWVVGNLNGAYGYSANTYGLAAGDVAETWMAMDATNGFRIKHGSATVAQVDAAGAATFTGVTVQSAASGERTVLSTDGLKLYSASANIGIFDGAGVRIQPTSASSGWDAKYMYGWIGAYAGLRYYRDSTPTPANDVLEVQTQGRNALISFVSPSDGSFVAGWTFHYDPAGSGAVAFYNAGATDTQIGLSMTPITRIYASQITLGGTQIGAFVPTAWSGTACDAGKFVTDISGTDGIISGVTCGTPSPLQELATLRAMVADLQARLAALETRR